MDSILFSVNPKITDMYDATKHLKKYKKLYFEVKFPINKNNFHFPIKGFIHLSGLRIGYIVDIVYIFQFSSDHYDPILAKDLKPGIWIEEYQKNTNGARDAAWKNALVLTKIVPFDYDTYSLTKVDGGKVTHPPHKYIKVLSPID